MNHQDQTQDDTVAEVQNILATQSFGVVCEHASALIPAAFANLPMASDALKSKVTWDPGTMALAEGISEKPAPILIATKSSSEVCECNRPPDAPDAIPARGKAVEVPGSTNLIASEAAKAPMADTLSTRFGSAIAGTATAAC